MLKMAQQLFLSFRRFTLPFIIIIIIIINFLVNISFRLFTEICQEPDHIY
jgi:hypothetical protein